MDLISLKLSLSGFLAQRVNGAMGQSCMEPWVRAAWYCCWDRLCKCYSTISTSTICFSISHPDLTLKREQCEEWSSLSKPQGVPHTGRSSRRTLSCLGMQRYEHLMKQSPLTRGSITQILKQSYQQLSDNHSQNHPCRSHSTGPKMGRLPFFLPF